MRVSVVIVSWNVQEDLRRCLASVLGPAENLPVEVIVVDNASEDGTVRMVEEEFPAVRVLANNHNRGFAAAANRGLAAAVGQYVVLLNPDTEVLPGALAAMAGYLEANPEAGVVAPQLVNEDRTVQSSRRRFPTRGTAFLESTVLQRMLPGHPLLRRYYMTDVSDDGVQEVDWAVGACLMVRRRVVADAGPLDDRFFMYSEEMDWCRRIKAAGWKIVYLPGAQVVHFGGRSADQDVPARHIHFHSSKVLFFAKHYGKWFGGLLRWYLLGTYLFQGLGEAVKLALGHKPQLRKRRLQLVGTVLRSRLREPAPGNPKPARVAVVAPRREGGCSPAGLECRGDGVRIMLVSAEFPPKRGGVGDYTDRLAGALAGQGAEVSVLTSPVPEGRWHLTPEHAVTVDRAVSDWNWACWEAVIEGVRRWRPDVVSIQYQTGAYGMHPAINLLPMRLRMSGEVPLISTTFHDLLLPYLFPKAGNLRRSANYALARFSDCLIVTNEEDWLQLSARWADKLRLIPIGSNIDVRPPDRFEPQAWRQSLGLGPQDVLLVNFGFFTAGKGLEVLLQALGLLNSRESLRRYRLVLIGKGSGDSDVTHVDYESRLRELAVRLGVHKDVEWMGYLSPELTSGWLLAADAGVFPFREGASLRSGSLAAALAHGLPVVTTSPGSGEAPGSHGCARGLVNGENILMVDRLDAARLAAGIERVSGEDELRRRLKAGALRTAASRQWDEIARSVVEFYRERLVGRTTDGA